MANSAAFREALALAAATACTHINVCTGDPGTGPAASNESTGSRVAVTWTGGAVDGVVTGAQVNVTAPAGTYTYVALFGGSSGSNYQTSYQLAQPITLAAQGPIQLTPSLTGAA